MVRLKNYSAQGKRPSMFTRPSVTLSALVVLMVLALVLLNGGKQFFSSITLAVALILAAIHVALFR